MAPRLQLESLECRSQEDWIGVDSCYLEIQADDDQGTHLEKNMRTGDVWDINRTIEFERSARISLTEQDDFTCGLDENDFIDEFEVSSTAVDRIRAKAVLVGDGAEYWLQYNLTGCSGDEPGLPSCVASLNSDHYQQPSCMYAHRIKDENLLQFSCVDAAKRSGRHPCKRCKS